MVARAGQLLLSSRRPPLRALRDPPLLSRPLPDIAPVRGGVLFSLIPPGPPFSGGRFRASGSPLLSRSAGGHDGGARHQRGVQDLEEKHSLLVRSGDDTRFGVAQPHRTVVA